jgi:YHS domain-containing protein
VIVMSIRLFFLLLALGLVMASQPTAAGQHEGHQGTATTIDAAQVAQCGQAHAIVNGLVEVALKRVEAARLTNNATAMRDAVDDLQAALVDIRQQLAPCGQLAASSADVGNQGHAMPNVQQAPAAAPGTPPIQPASPATAPPAVPPRAPSPAAAGPHAAHAASPAAQATVTRSAAPAAPARPSVPAADDAHTGRTEPAAPPPHLMPVPPTGIANLKCRTPVDPKTAPRMLHRGRMYYFCSEQDRAAFANDPSKYALPTGEAAPAHAH